MKLHLQVFECFQRIMQMLVIVEIGEAAVKKKRIASRVTESIS